MACEGKWRHGLKPAVPGFPTVNTSFFFSRVLTTNGGALHRLCHALVGLGAGGDAAKRCATGPRGRRGSPGGVGGGVGGGGP